MSDSHAAHKVNYWLIFFYLFVLTAFEVGIVYVTMPRWALALMLILCALAKAALVAIYFMHLKFEKKMMGVIAAAPLIFGTILTIALVPEADKMPGADITGGRSSSDVEESHSSE